MVNLLNSMILKFEQNTNINIMTCQNRFFLGRGGPVRLFGLLWGFTSSRWGSRHAEISDHVHPLP